MYVLILWLKTKETDIVLDKDVIKEEKEVKAKWGNSWYPAKVLQRSNSKKWLETLKVSEDGEILPADHDDTNSVNLLNRKQEARRSEKSIKILQDTVLAKENRIILGEKTIFEKHSVTDRADDSENNGNLPQIESESELAAELSSDESYTLNDTRAGIAERSCICSKFPKITEEDVEKFSQILELAKALRNSENNFQETSSKLSNGSSKKNANISSKKRVIPIIEGSDILLPEWKLEVLKETLKKNPKEMVRRMMTEILGKEKLKKMSPTGKNGWDPIPSNIFEDVEMFVHDSTKKHYRLKHNEYRECLTAFCATLRNPKQKNTSSRSKKSMKNKQNREENSEKEEEQGQQKSVFEHKRDTKHNEDLKSTAKTKHDEDLETQEEEELAENNYRIVPKNKSEQEREKQEKEKSVKVSERSVSEKECEQQIEQYRMENREEHSERQKSETESLTEQKKPSSSRDREYEFGKDKKDKAVQREKNEKADKIEEGKVHELKGNERKHESEKTEHDEQRKKKHVNEENNRKREQDQQEKESEQVMRLEEKELEMKLAAEKYEEKIRSLEQQLKLKAGEENRTSKNTMSTRSTNKRKQSEKEAVLSKKKKK